MARKKHAIAKAIMAADLDIGRWVLQLRLKDADAGELAVAFGEVEPVANDELIGDMEADEIGAYAGFPAALLLQQDAKADGGRIQLLDLVDDPLASVAGIEDIVDDENVGPFQVEPQHINDLWLLDWTGVITVAGDAHAIQPHRNTDMAEEVRREEDRPVDDGDDGDFIGIRVGLGDLIPQHLDALANFLLGDVN